MIDKISQHLEIIDERLAFDEIPIKARIFHAAWMFVSDFVIEIDTGKEGLKKPGEITNYASERWFQLLYAKVEKWYRARYGAIVDNRSVRYFQGVTLIANTPFELQVPTTVVNPGAPGKTAWLSWPDTVLNEENATDWILNAPNNSSYSEESQLEAINLATEVASKLRAISCRLTGARSNDEITKGFLSGVTIHLESAANLIIRGRKGESFSRAQWELQMACECAYKGLLQQRTGSFVESHDLFFLHDRSLPYTERVPRELLSTIPRWKDAANLRYGQGDQPTIFGIFSWYRAVLAVIAEVLDSLEGLRLSNARIEIQKPPWLGE